jgi:hypothetical protein
MIKIMKQALIATISFLILNSTAVAQYFAPLGATWHYTHRYNGPQTDFNKLTVIDTAVFINTKQCSKISKTHYNCSPQYEYIYSENNVTFRLNQISNQFDTLYNFNLIAGEGWGNQIIDSVVYVNVNGTLLKGLYVNGNTFGGPILQRIGEPHSFISDVPACDPVDGGWIRCYSDSIIGSYKFSPEDCEVIYTGIEENSLSKLSFYPNPTTSPLNIDLGEALSNIKVTLTNSLGQVLLSENYTSTSFINLNIDAPTGIYFLQLETANGETKTIKVLKE